VCLCAFFRALSLEQKEFFFILNIIYTFKNGVDYLPPLPPDDLPLLEPPDDLPPP
jgi:hypothetical protein